MTNDYHVDEHSKDARKYGGMTKLERDKAKEMEADAETAEVMQAGQENEKAGKKVVKQIEQINQAQKQKEKDDALNALDMKQKMSRSYKEELAKTMVGWLQMLDWIRGWKADVVITDGGTISLRSQTGVSKTYSSQDGLLLVVTTPDGRVFHRGIRTTQDPILDYMAIQTLTIQTENVLDKERGQLLTGEPEQPGLVDHKGNAIKHG